MALASGLPSLRLVLARACASLVRHRDLRRVVFNPTLPETDRGGEPFEVGELLFEGALGFRQEGLSILLSLCTSHQSITRGTHSAQVVPLFLIQNESRNFAHVRLLQKILAQTWQMYVSLPHGQK